MVLLCEISGFCWNPPISRRTDLSRMEQYRDCSHCTVRKHRAVGEIHTGQHSRQRRDDPSETPGEFRKQSYCTSDQLCLFLQQILWNTIDFKLNSSLVRGRHTNLPEISESFTCNLTESFLVSLLMINSPGLVWERKILPALTQDVSFFLSRLQSYNSLWPQHCCSVKAVM